METIHYFFLLFTLARIKDFYWGTVCTVRYKQVSTLKINGTEKHFEISVLFDYKKALQLVPTTSTGMVAQA